MDSFDKLPDKEIKPLGEMSIKFLELNISSFKDACLYIKKVLKEKILPSKEMEGISERTLLKARGESLILLLNSIKKE